MFIRPKKYIVSSGPEQPELGYVDIRTLADSVCRYDLNDMDAAWLELTNEEFKEMGEGHCPDELGEAHRSITWSLPQGFFATWLVL